MLVAPGDLSPCRVPGAAPCVYWSVGSSPRSLGTMLAPSSSECGYAPPCWAQSITQRSHCNCDLHWQLMLCANQTSWAATSHRVNNWTRYAGSRHTGEKWSLRPITKWRFVANKRVFSSFQLLPAHCLVGELSHPVELFLHLVFFCVTTRR